MVASFKWQNKMMRNIVRKVARKYFCRDASNPSEPAARNSSDSELEKRLRPRGENPTTVAKLSNTESKVQFKQ